MGGCYIKGLPTTNYVWYSGFMYRIMGINSDGTVRLITEENVTTIPWGATGSSESYANSYVRDWLNNYFLSNQKGTDIISGGNFCQNMVSNNTELSRTTCESETIFNDKAGLISIDEYNLAGSGRSYLKNAQSFWTMSLYSYNTTVWTVMNDGYPNYIGATSTYGIRVIINIKPTTIITLGDGTINNYYVLNEKKENTVNVSLADSNISSGEYVKFAGKNYRVVSVNGINIKMILDEYYTTNLAYGTTCTLCTNSDVFNWLVAGDTNYASKLLNTTWYQGANWTDGDYKTNLNSTANSYTGYMGLIRVGEILSGISETILNPVVGGTRTANSNSNSNAKNYWTATPYSGTNAWVICEGGDAGHSGMTYTFGTRPLLNVNSATTILRGKGTPTSPYEI